MLLRPGHSLPSGRTVRPWLWSAPRGLIFLILGGAAVACDRAPSPAGLVEWTPADHDGEPGRAAPNQGARSADAGGPAALVESTWRTRCATCHGPMGKGDGPQGPMVKAQDLSREDFQARTDDAQMLESIRNGKGRMPKFDELPDDVAKGLVARIRSFRGR